MSNWLTNWWARFSGMPLPETEREKMPRLMRGALPSPRHRLCAAMPHFVTVPPPPQFLWKPAQMSIWGNNQFGDCTVAEEAFAKSATAGVFIPDEEVISWARHNHSLNGNTLIDVLDRMEAKGFPLNGQMYDDGSSSSVDWTNAMTLQSAITQGPIKIGVGANQLEHVVADPPVNGWLATGFTCDQDLDHCVSLCGYGSIAWLASQLDVTMPNNIDTTASAYGLFTWGTIGIIDTPSMLAITGEAWLRTPTTVIK